MEETIDIQSSTERIYNDKMIYIGTFLGGPLVAGYFIAENFKVFGEHNNAKKTWIYTIIATVIIFGGIFLIPDNVKIPNQIIPFIYTAIVYYLAKHFQGQHIEAHLHSGGGIFGWWRTICVGLIGLVVVFIAVFALVSFTDSTVSEDSTKFYGVMKHEIVFDKSNISESEVDKLAQGFVNTTFFDEVVTKYVYVKKVKNDFEISISCDKSLTNIPDGVESFVQLRNDLQTMFPDNKIVFNLVVDKLDNIIKRLE